MVLGYGSPRKLRQALNAGSRAQPARLCPCPRCGQGEAGAALDPLQDPTQEEARAPYPLVAKAAGSPVGSPCPEDGPSCSGASPEQWRPLLCSPKHGATHHREPQGSASYCHPGCKTSPPPAFPWSDSSSQVTPPRTGWVERCTDLRCTPRVTGLQLCRTHPQPAEGCFESSRGAPHGEGQP